MALIVARRTPADRDVMALFDGILGEVVNQEQAIRQLLQNHERELPLLVAFTFHMLQHALDEAVLMARCDTEDCRNVRAVQCSEGWFCQDCAAKWTTCEHCRQSLLVAESICDDDGRAYHEGCYGPDEDARYESAVGR